MKKLLLATALCSLFVSQIKANEESVTIDKGVIEPVYIAICPFFGEESKNDVISMIVKSDLSSTGLFLPIKENAFLQNISSYNVDVAYQNWNAIHARYLVFGDVQYVENNKVKVRFKLYDILLQRKEVEYVLEGNIRSLRKMAHLVSNEIYKRITGSEGYFDTKVAYVSVTRQRNGKKINRLAIMDHDGAAHKFLTDGSNIVLTPRFSPDKDELIFFAYGEKVVRGRRKTLVGNLYKYSFDTNTITAVFKDSPYMNYAPRYSPDGKKLLYSMSNDSGYSSLYVMDLATKSVKRLTRGACIDTSPCYSPDMKKIVFNSDRGGSQQIYMMNVDGSDIHRVSFGKGRYATPVWSPDGKWIAFTRMWGRKFYIGIMKPDGSKERLLACGHLVESPAWAPNSRVLMFAHQDRSGTERMHSIDITGYNQREIPTPMDGITPEWAHPMNFVN